MTNGGMTATLLERYRKRDVRSWGGVAHLRDLLAGISALWCYTQDPTSRHGVVEAFERGFARLVGADDAVSFGTGRGALYAILRALGIGTGDDVLVTAYTCTSVPNAVALAGARPIFVDIDPRNLTTSPTDVSKNMTSRARAVIVQHTYGCPADLEAITALARQRGVVLVEDCSHALGSTYDGRHVGTVGDVGFYSTGNTKCLSTGEGGMVVTKYQDLAKSLRVLQQQYALPEAQQVKHLMVRMAAHTLWHHPLTRYARCVLHGLRRWAASTADPVFENAWHDILPSWYLTQLSPVQATIGLRQLQHWTTLRCHRQRVAESYRAILEASWEWTPQVPPHATPVFLVYPVRVENASVLADQVIPARAGIDVWLTDLERDGRRWGYKPGNCREAEDAARHIGVLPTHQWVRASQTQSILARAGAGRLLPAVAAAQHRAIPLTGKST